MQTTPWAGKTNVESHDAHPAVYVSWVDAVEFCKRLTAQASDSDEWRYELPTEAQWEYACRAGTTTRFHFGDDMTDLKDYSWFLQDGSDSSKGGAHRVGAKRGNAWHFYDMHGNVMEWCRDSSPTHIARGGSWKSLAFGHRVTSRYELEPTTATSFIGFRVARVYK